MTLGLRFESMKKKLMTKTNPDNLIDSCFPNIISEYDRSAMLQRSNIRTRHLIFQSSLIPFTGHKILKLIN